MNFACSAGVRGRPSTKTELEKVKERMKFKKQAVALDREVEFMKYKSFGKTPEELASFIKLVADGSDEAQGQAKNMLEKGDSAFVPDCTEDSLHRYRVLLGEMKKEKLELYELLKKEGVYYGGE